MSYKVGKRAIDFLLENAGNHRNLDVDFFCGEPLMAWKTVKQIVGYARNKERKRVKKTFRFTFTTNAILKDSLESPIVSLQLEDPHLHREHQDDKLSILDVSATLDTGTKVNIEIQLNNNHDMIKRSLYYWGKLYTSQLQKGMPYSSLSKTITINLLNFVLFPEYEEFYTTGKLWNIQQQKQFSDDIEIHVIELPKLMEQWWEEKVNPWEDSFVRCLLLLPANEDEHLTQTLEDITMNQDPILQKAMNKWERLSCIS